MCVCGDWIVPWNATINSRGCTTRLGSGVCVTQKRVTALPVGGCQHRVLACPVTQSPVGAQDLSVQKNSARNSAPTRYCPSDGCDMTWPSPSKLGSGFRGRRGGTSFAPQLGQGSLKWQKLLRNTKARWLGRVVEIILHHRGALRPAPNIPLLAGRQ